MNNAPKVLLVIVVLAVLGGAGWMFGKNKTTDQSTGTDQPATQQTTETNEQTTTTPSAEAQNVIAFTEDGFSPDVLNIKSGDTVTIVNKSGSDLDFQSNPHPDHTENQELNVGTIADGESKTVTLTKQGSWGYHNHLDSSQGGEINVE